jgi:hypothetical protein
VFSIIEPFAITDEEFCRYVVGEAAHEIIVRHFMTRPDRFRSQMQIQYEKVVGRIDVYDKLFERVIEIKTSNSAFILRPNKWDVKQLRYYMLYKFQNHCW